MQSSDEWTGQGLGCKFCFKSFTVEEIDNPELTYREVASWVTGPKSDSPVLRERTGRMAHKECVEKVVNGVAPDQEPLPGIEE